MIRHKRLLRFISVILTVALLNQILVPIAAWALTSGPSQPEMQQFTPISSTDYVDLFTGDFSYNIPLLDVEGFPINLSYHSGVTADQEATWVGLGWNINPGVVNRQLRGIPDDFKGELTKVEQNIKENFTIGARQTLGAEIVGFSTTSDNPMNVGLSLGVSLGFCYNSYKKFGVDMGFQFGISGPLSAGIDITNSSQGGITLSPSLGVSLKQNSYNSSISASINSREGLQEITLSYHGGGHFRNVIKPSLSLSFAKPVFYPSFDLPRKNLSFAFNFKMGAEFFLVHPNFASMGYYNSESLLSHALSRKSYGTLYEEAAGWNEDVLRDFEREKDIPFRQSSVNLAIPFASFDIFNVSANDINSSYHILRNDLGIFHDPYINNPGTSATAGFDIGIGNIYHMGSNFNLISSNSFTSRWNENNEFKPRAQFIKPDSSSLFEPAYFKDAGEMTSNQGNIYNQMGGTCPTTVFIAKIGSDARAFNSPLITKGCGLISGNSIIKNPDRIRRQQLFAFLTADEASLFALDKTINSYSMNTLPYSDCTNNQYQSLLRTNKPAHHISEITVLKEDGKRYIYGIPAYNSLQRESTFNVQGNSVDEASNLVEFSATDASINNVKGKDRYFDKKEIPAYAHSYLLTAILSPDYVDNTNDGVTDDDLGQAYKLDYTLSTSNFKWRTPLQSGKAGFHEGMKSVSYDNKGSIIYGEKEIWYLHAIESRNYVAVFTLVNRNDGLGVTGELGGIDTTNKLKAIKSIDLYSKADLIKNNDKAIPIKSVHFNYDYTLCKGVPNQAVADSGKLTLKEIYFTYGKSARGKLNKYKFTYDDGGSFANPNYSLVNNDRWGNYTNHEGTYVDNLSTNDFPYTVQDTLANEYAGAWSLRQIDLPSGGIMEIKYESDSYAYVDSKRAAQMVKIRGFNKTSTAIYSDELYSNLPNLDFDNNDYVFLNLPRYVHSKTEFRELYLDSLEHLYYQFLVNVNNKADTAYEYVKGYATIKSYGINQPDIAAHDSTNIGWIQLESTTEELVGLINPVSFASWQYLRLNLPDKAYPGSDLSENTSPLGLSWAAIALFSNFRQLIFGFNNVARMGSKGRYVDTSRSFIRLNCPTFNKYGGGSRVKKITLSDNWYSMVGGTQDSYDYGQEYKYTKEKNGTISSGVASYEPIIGNEENNFRQPVFYEEKIIAAPNNFYYAEEPLGESLFPAPNVGYSEVMVRNLSRDNVFATGPGFSMYKFYTARDYPVKCDRTDLVPLLIKPNPILKILKLNVKKSMNASQGFTVEVNDMHGKLKEESVYNEQGSLISSTQYHYKTDDDSATQKHLNNNFQLVHPDGSISSGDIGIDFEVYQDMRQQETNTDGFGMSINTDLSLFGVYPIGTFTLFGSITDLQNRFRSTATTKFIKRYGILDKITVTENGSQVSTENVLYDSETGSVLLTKVTNEFGDPIYKFNYPAYWINEGMGQAYKNVGAIFKNVTFSNGVISLAYPEAYFQPGDEVAVESKSLKMLGSSKAYVANLSGNLVFLRPDGIPLNEPNPGTIKILRSGFRNINASTATISSLEYPVASDSIKFSTSTRILNTEVTIYKELWQSQGTATELYCDSIAPPVSSCLSKIADSIFNEDHFSYPRAKLTVGDVVVNSLPCNDFIDSNANLPFGIVSGIIGSHPYLVTNGMQYPGVTDSVYVNLNSFTDFTAKVGKCTFYFVDTIGGPLPIPPSGYSYYFFVPISSPTNAVAVYYTGPAAYYIPPMDWVGETGKRGSPVGYAYMDCEDCYSICRTLTAGDTINPYILNMLGVWRPSKTYAYHELRDRPLGSFKPSVQDDGAFTSFNPIYNFDQQDRVWNIDTSSSNWVRANENILYDEHSNEIEAKDALNIHSSALYRYNGSLPIAVTHNAQLQQIANDNFEDYTFQLSCFDPCASSHWDFADVLTASVTISDSNAHSGNFSLRVAKNDSVEEVKSILSSGTEILDAMATGYTVGDGGLIPQFSPTAGTYLFSAWLKVDTLCNCKSYWGNRVTIKLNGSGTVYNFQSSGPIIDGWQQIQGTFTVTGTDNAVKVKLRANPNRVTYFDDIRIFPLAANMKSFVYDERTLRLMATLDENNYATFYEYDEEGNLVRVKKETERGIVTIQEGRNKLVKIQ